MITKLVNKWAELEPDRCRVSSLGVHLHSSLLIYWKMLEADPVNHAVLLSSVMNAITSRGWEYRLSSGIPYPDTTHAVVWTEAHPHRQSYDFHAHTPHDALLGAYITAMEDRL